MPDILENFRDLFTNPETARQYPWIIVGMFMAPFFLLAFVRRIYPHVPLAVVLLVPFALSLLVVVEPGMFFVVVLIDLIIACVALIDLFTVPSIHSVSIERRTMRIVSIKQKHQVTLTVTNNSKRSLTIWIRDDVPQDFSIDPKQFVIRLAPRSRSTVHYELLASRRGAFQLDQVYLRVRSWLGLWQSFLNYPEKTVIHVYPDMKQLAEYSILARTNRLSLMGVRRTRKIGQDNEFERLRDYTRDDNFKHIDWRTTARRSKLTVKDFQTSQSQRIIFLVDCGRMMTNISSDISLLDHALNSMLMMSYVALSQGDSVGLICFSDEIHTYVPPRGGMKQMNQMLHASFDRFPKLVESRYDQAFLYMRTKQPKRSLVVLITNIIDEVNAHQLQQYLGTLSGRHLPLGVLLRDHQLFDVADRQARDETELFRSAAAAEILTWRHQVLTDLEHKGVLTIDTFPEDITAPLVNRYLEIKARHLL